jgi:hypothetical protein
MNLQKITPTHTQSKTSNSSIISIIEKMSGGACPRRSATVRLPGRGIGYIAAISRIISTKIKKKKKKNMR